MQVIRKQWSKDEPQIFAASRTQVNINIKPQVQNIEGVDTQGYSYDTVIEDANAWMYDDAALLQRAINYEADEYLKSTDWYIARYSENGKAIPDEVKAARDEARARIVH